MQPALLYLHGMSRQSFGCHIFFREGLFTARSLLKFQLGMSNQLTPKHDSIKAAEKLNNASYLSDKVDPCMIPLHVRTPEIPDVYIGLHNHW
jgi:hypothetical protein